MANPDVDALVVGAGFGGIYQVHTLRNMGLSVRLVEAAPDVGGTWYHNRYPGAMSDTESYIYRYSWDKEDLQTYPWSQTYLFQPEILAYLRHIVDKHDLRKYMEFNTKMVSADFDENTNLWHVGLKTDEGDKEMTARYLITALGVLSTPHFPDIPGLDSFKNGKVVHSTQWDPNIDVKDKRVGIIGCGSTGVQIITALAPQVKSLTSFQRTPQYSVPSGLKPVTPAYRAEINANYNTIISDCRNSVTAFGIPEPTRSFHDVPDPAERDRIFEDLWQQGNAFRFMFSGFGDITTDAVANEAACDFIRRKIAAIVTDPDKARILQPHDTYARRPLCDNGYYEQFNRPNVHLVDLHATPIEAIVPDGVQTTDGTVHPLDILILATGFDALDGSYAPLRITGRAHHTLGDHWSTPRGPVSYLGITVAGFPNFFMVGGPQGPFCNFPPAVEGEVEVISEIIQKAESTRTTGGLPGAAGVVEPEEEAEKGWVEECEKVAKGSLFGVSKGSWIFGRNVGGKSVACRFYFGGLRGWKGEVGRVVEGGWRGFRGIG